MHTWYKVWINDEGYLVGISYKYSNEAKKKKVQIEVSAH